MAKLVLKTAGDILLCALVRQAVWNPYLIFVAKAGEEIWIWKVSTYCTFSILRFQIFINRFSHSYISWWHWCLVCLHRESHITANEQLHLLCFWHLRRCSIEIVPLCFHFVFLRLIGYLILVGWISLTKVMYLKSTPTLERCDTYVGLLFFKNYFKNQRKMKNKAKGRDLIIKDGIFSARVQKFRVSRVMLFNETGNTFFLRLSFYSFPVSSLRCKAPRSGHSRGGGRELHIGKGMVMVWKPVGNQYKLLGQAAI